MYVGIAQEVKYCYYIIITFFQLRDSLSSDHSILVKREAGGKISVRLEPGIQGTRVKGLKWGEIGRGLSTFVALLALFHRKITRSLLNVFAQVHYWWLVF